MYKTIEEAMHAWVNGFNAVPTNMLRELYRNDPDSWEELTTPAELTGCENSQDFFPSWGTMWSFSSNIDDYWLENNGGIETMSSLGFNVYRHDEYGYWFGLDAGGLNFYDEFWTPLYRKRGLRWHESEELTFCFRKRKDIPGLCRIELGGFKVAIDEAWYDYARVFIDDKPYNGEFKSFTGTVSEDKVFLAIANAYLRGDTEDFDFISGWETFDSLKEGQAFSESGLMMSFPQIGEDHVTEYTLDLAVKGRRYYSSDSGVMILTDGGSVATDIEEFYVNALLDEAKAVAAGECLYVSDNAKICIRESE